MQFVEEFIPDVLKISFLIYIATFCVSLLQDKFAPEKIRNFVKEKNPWLSYLAAVGMGTLTPFCSCSSIPVFIGFLAAGIPLGISMAFLISSPLISEIALAILIALPKHGIYLTMVYLLSGSIISILGGWLCDHFRLERHIIFKFPKQTKIARNTSCKPQSFYSCLYSAHFNALQTLKNIGIYIIISVLAGLGFRYFMPEDFISYYLQGRRWWEVPLATLVGIPFYANHGALMPFIEALLEKNISMGTCMTLLMSATALSLPEIILLKKIFDFKLLAVFILWLTISFIITGFLLNNL